MARHALPALEPGGPVAGPDSPGHEDINTRAQLGGIDAHVR